MEEEKFYSRYFVYKHRNAGLYAPIKKEQEEESGLTKALRDAVKSRKVPKVCPECNGKLDYKGLGHYKCIECDEDVYTNYGKVRKVIDEHGTLNVNEVCNLTGLTKNEIKELVDDGSIVIVGGKIQAII